MRFVVLEEYFITRQIAHRRRRSNSELLGNAYTVLIKESDWAKKGSRAISSTSECNVDVHCGQIVKISFEVENLVF